MVARRVGHFRDGVAWSTAAQMGRVDHNATPFTDKTCQGLCHQATRLPPYGLRFGDTRAHDLDESVDVLGTPCTCP